MDGTVLSIQSIRKIAYMCKFRYKAVDIILDRRRTVCLCEWQNTGGLSPEYHIYCTHFFFYCHRKMETHLAVTLWKIVHRQRKKRIHVNWYALIKYC